MTDHAELIAKLVRLQFADLHLGELGTTVHKTAAEAASVIRTLVAERDRLAGLVGEAVLAEREACAQIVRTYPVNDERFKFSLLLADIADAIHASVSLHTDNAPKPDTDSQKGGDANSSGPIPASPRLDKSSPRSSDTPSGGAMLDEDDERQLYLGKLVTEAYERSQSASLPKPQRMETVEEFVRRRRAERAEAALSAPREVTEEMAEACALAIHNEFWQRTYGTETGTASSVAKQTWPQVKAQRIAAAKIGLVAALAASKQGGKS